MNSYIGIAATAAALFVVVLAITQFVMPYLYSVNAALSNVLLR